MKPLFMWAGGKTKLLKQYMPYMPHTVNSYCEPFFGGGAMFIYVMNRYKPNYARINDINPSIVGIYSAIKNDCDEFVKHLELYESVYLPLSKEDRKKYYYDVREAHAYDYQNMSATEESATLYFLMKTGFNGIFQINKNTNNRYGTPAGLLNQKTEVYNRDVLAWWHEVLQVADITNTDWKTACSGLPDDTFFFFDPPYRESFADYGFSFTDENLVDLINFADSKKSVMLSNRDDEGWFDNHNRTLSVAKFPITYTAGRRKKTEDGYEAKKATEILLHRTDIGISGELWD